VKAERRTVKTERRVAFTKRSTAKTECRIPFTECRFPFTECRTVKAEFKDFSTGCKSAWAARGHDVVAGRRTMTIVRFRQLANQTVICFGRRIEQRA
jgi:hypothetical protein